MEDKSDVEIFESLLSYLYGEDIKKTVVNNEELDDKSTKKE